MTLSYFLLDAADFSGSFRCSVGSVQTNAGHTGTVYMKFETYAQM